MDEMEKDAGIIANCVDGIKEGLRKINVCRDVKKDEVWNPTLPLEKAPQNKDIMIDLLPCVPSAQRTQEWVETLPRPESTNDSIVSLTHLPMRGTILPTRYSPNEEQSSDEKDTEEMRTSSSLSQYEEARGTQGRGTPPLLPQGQLRLDAIFLKLAQNLEREARKQMSASGQQHLLSYNLMDVYRHQVSGLPLGTTPEIVPFMSPNAMASNNAIQQPARVVHPLACSSNAVNKTLENTSAFHYCQWSKCQRCFQTARELLDHIDRIHIPLHVAGKLACRWSGCDRTFPVRYKLLLHINNVHCREAIILDDRMALLSVKPALLMKHGRKQLAPISNKVNSRPQILCTHFLHK